MILVERAAAVRASGPDVRDPGEADVQRLDLAIPGRPGWQTRLRYRIDACSGFARTPDGWLYVATPVGLACYPDLATVLAQARADGLDRATPALEDLRLSAFVAYTERTGELRFGRSLDGFASLYFGGEPPRLVIADSNVAVARRLGPVRLSKADEDEWCRTENALPEGSFLEGVKRCFAGVLYAAAPGAHGVARRLMAPDADPVDLAGAVQLVGTELRKVWATYGARRLALQLSGGIDSRTLLVSLMDAVRQGILRRDQVLLMSILFPGFDCDESAPIREVARLSGFEWVGIEADAGNVRQAYEESLHAGLPPYPTNFMDVLSVPQMRQRGIDVMVGGWGGDEVFDFELGDVLARPLAARLRAWRLIRWLREPRGTIAEAKTLALTCVGRRAMRHLHRTFTATGLPRRDFNAHRLGMRLAVATNTGYETGSVLMAPRGIATDAPFYRSALWPRLDPLGYLIPSGYRFKAVACRYMGAVEPAFGAVPAAKVAFDSAVQGLLQIRRVHDGVIDGQACLAYSRRNGYDGWKQRFRHGEQSK